MNSGSQRRGHSYRPSSLVNPGVGRKDGLPEMRSDAVEEVTGSEYLECLSLVTSLGWSQPSVIKLQLGALSEPPFYEERCTLPQLFYTDSPSQEDLPEEEEEEKEEEEEEEEEEDVERNKLRLTDTSSEVHPEPLDLIKRVPPQAVAPVSVVPYIPHCPTGEDDYRRRVREEIGMDFPPVMTQYIEAMVHRHWREWDQEGLIPNRADVETVFHSIVLEAHVFFTRLLKAYIRSLSHKEGWGVLTSHSAFVSTTEKMVAEVKRELHKERILKQDKDQFQERGEEELVEEGKRGGGGGGGGRGGGGGGGGRGGETESEEEDKGIGGTEERGRAGEEGEETSKGKKPLSVGGEEQEADEQERELGGGRTRGQKRIREDLEEDDFSKRKEQKRQKRRREESKMATGIDLVEGEDSSPSTKDRHADADTLEGPGSQTDSGLRRSNRVRANASYWYNWKTSDDL